MSQSNPTTRFFAGRLIEHEGRVHPPLPSKIPTALPVIEKLHPILATFMGRAGYHALLLRALVLARTEAPYLLDVEVTADGNLTNFYNRLVGKDSADVIHASEVLLARLIDLLVAFIGEVLTLRLIHGIWPNVPKDDDFTQGNSHDSTH